MEEALPGENVEDLAVSLEAHQEELVQLADLEVAAAVAERTHLYRHRSSSSC